MRHDTDSDAPTGVGPAPDAPIDVGPDTPAGTHLGTLALPLGDRLAGELADLADARGLSVEELAGEAVERYVRFEATLVRHEAMRLALKHGALLRRLGE
ncbi:hypothetical protein [Streptomyces roseicoloratus]|uniref:hypothetical protein n=1 Tax=Streptomyces roseicoloratus TaxID=2508722 RepID=UPI001009D24F|nr:hypothetical protein [Streptomyces roseicoloratus]